MSKCVQINFSSEFSFKSELEIEIVKVFARAFVPFSIENTRMKSSTRKSCKTNPLHENYVCIDKCLAVDIFLCRCVSLCVGCARLRRRKMGIEICRIVEMNKRTHN